VSLRGLNRNHNHELKNIFKGAAIIAATKAGPLQEFYAALVAKGTRLEMARAPQLPRRVCNTCPLAPPTDLA
jgi:hypothetical protein